MQSSTSANDPAFFPGFRPLAIEAGGVRFSGVTGGEGPPVLLLHGFPQTHVAWRRIAPTLAKSYTVIIPDLPGYGASRPDQMVPRWTKRRAGAALVALMKALGHDGFAVVGHDRGTRVGYRLTLDHPDRVVAYASLAVVPTLDVMANVDLGFAMKNYHWFFLAQEADLPERLLAADPDTILARILDGMTGGREVIDQAARDAYRAAFRDSAVRHAICEDYRAAVTEDLAFDRADRETGRSFHARSWSYGPRRIGRRLVRRRRRSGAVGPMTSWDGRPAGGISRPRTLPARSSRSSAFSWISRDRSVNGTHPKPLESNEADAAESCQMIKISRLSIKYFQGSTSCTGSALLSVRMHRVDRKLSDFLRNIYLDRRITNT